MKIQTIETRDDGNINVVTSVTKTEEKVVTLEDLKTNFTGLDNKLNELDDKICELEKEREEVESNFDKVSAYLRSLEEDKTEETPVEDSEELNPNNI